MSHEATEGTSTEDRGAAGLSSVTVAVGLLLTTVLATATVTVTVAPVQAAGRSPDAAMPPPGLVGPAPAAPERMRLLQGRLIGRDRGYPRPLAGVRIVALSAEARAAWGQHELPAEPPDSPRVLADTLTDADGSYALKVPASSSVLALTSGFRPAWMEGGTQTLQPVVSLEQARADRHRREWLGPAPATPRRPRRGPPSSTDATPAAASDHARRLEGTVRDLGGRGVASALVIATVVPSGGSPELVSALSARDGSFELALPPAAAALAAAGPVTIEAATSGAWSLPSPVPDDARPVTITLDSRPAFDLAIRGEIERSSVLLLHCTGEERREWSAVWSGQTIPMGWLEPGSWFCWFEAEGLESADEKALVVREGETALLELEALEPRSLAITVTDAESGSALAGVTIRGPFFTVTETDEQGQASLLIPQRAFGSVQFESATHSSLERWVRSETTSLEVALEKPLQWKGRVVDESGRGLPGARLNLPCDRDRVPSRSDADGAFRFAAPPGCTDHLEATTTDASGAELEGRLRIDELTEGNTVTLTLKPARKGRLRIRVVEDGRPLAGARVIARRSLAASPTEERWTDARGRTEMELREGSWSLSLSPNHQVLPDFVERVVIEADSTVERTLEPPEPQRVAGRVTADGIPLAGARVQAVLRGRMATAATDARGEFDLALPARDMVSTTLEVRPPEGRDELCERSSLDRFAGGDFAGGDFAGGGWEDLVIDLTCAGVTGRLVRDGAPAAGLRVGGRVLSDGGGRFRLAGLRPGRAIDIAIGNWGEIIPGPTVGPLAPGEWRDVGDIELDAVAPRRVELHPESRPAGGMGRLFLKPVGAPAMTSYLEAIDVGPEYPLLPQSALSFLAVSREGSLCAGLSPAESAIVLKFGPPVPALLLIRDADGATADRAIVEVLSFAGSPDLGELFRRANARMLTEEGGLLRLPGYPPGSYLLGVSREGRVSQASIRIAENRAVTPHIVVLPE